jgi:hypothetical protein
VCAIAIAVLIRLSCFGFGVTKTFDDDGDDVKDHSLKQNKKKTKICVKNSVKSNINLSLSNFISCSIACVALVEKDINLSPIPLSIRDLASSKLLSLLSEMGNLTLDQLENSGIKNDNNEEIKENGSITILQYSMLILKQISQSDVLLINEEVQNDTIIRIADFVSSSPVTSSDLPKFNVRLTIALHDLITNSLFHIIAYDSSISIEVIFKLDLISLDLFLFILGNS